jgi:hypothetical protein
VIPVSSEIIRYALEMNRLTEILCSFYCSNNLTSLQALSPVNGIVNQLNSLKQYRRIKYKQIEVSLIAGRVDVGSASENEPKSPSRLLSPCRANPES